jgi:hypothetical protein
MLDPVDVDPDRDMRRPVPDVGAVADLDHDRVEVDHRIQRVEGPMLPGGDLVADLVGDLADRVV